MILKVCGWCKAKTGEESDGKTETMMTHGICRDCLYKVAPEHYRAIRDSEAARHYQLVNARWGGK